MGHGWGVEKGGDMCIPGWFMVICGRGQHSVIKNYQRNKKEPYIRPKAGPFVILTTWPVREAPFSPASHSCCVKSRLQLCWEKLPSHQPAICVVLNPDFSFAGITVCVLFLMKWNWWGNSANIPLEISCIKYLRMRCTSHHTFLDDLVLI